MEGRGKPDLPVNLVRRRTTMYLRAVGDGAKEMVLADNLYVGYMTY